MVSSRIQLCSQFKHYFNKNKTFSDEEIEPSRRMWFTNKVSIMKNLSTKEICINLLSCTIQTVLGYICLDFMIAITIHFISNQKDQKQALIDQNGVGLAYSIIGMGVMPMSLGINQALNVHVAQALGSKRIKLSRTYLNLTLYAHMMYFLPLCGILYLTKRLFILTIEEDPQATADATWIFLLPLILSTIFAIEFECFKTYMIACKIFTPFITIHVITTSLLILWCYLFIQKLEWELWGAGLGIIITEALNCIFLGIYLLFSNDSKNFSGFEWFPLVRKKWRLFVAYIKTSFNIVIHIYADFFVFQFLTFLALGLGNDAFGAQIAFSNINALYYKMPISISLALMTFVGEEMAQGRIQEAKKYSIIGVLILMAFFAILLPLLLVGKEQFINFYSGGKVGLTNQMEEGFPYVLSVMFVDGAQGTLTGILKGLNQSKIVTQSTLISYYVVGIPSILVLTFDWGFGFGIRGIWSGFAVANLTLFIFYLVLIIRTDWDKQASLIQQQVKEQNKLQNSTIVEDIYVD